MTDITTWPIYIHEDATRARVNARVASEVAPWTAKADRSGNPILPDEVYAVLREECAKHPGPAKHDTFGIVLNATAWRTRHLGMGLSRKTGGQRVDSPVGEIAEDIIQHRDSGHHWDVLGGAAVGAPLNPGQGPSIGVIDVRARPWVAPVEPAGTGTVTPPVQPPTPGEPPTPPPAAGVDLSAVLQRLDGIAATLASLPLAPSRGDIRQEMNELVLGPEVMGFLRQQLAANAGGAGGGMKCNFPKLRSAEAARVAGVMSDPEVPQEPR